MAATIDTSTIPLGADAANLGAWLKAAIAGGYVAHPPAATYTVTSPIVIYVNSTIQGPLGIDLGGATIVSQITDGSPVIQVVVGPGVDLRYLTFSNFTIQGNGREGDGLQLVAAGNDRWLYNFTVDNVTVNHVGGYGLDVQGSVFEGLVSNSWMTNDAKGGAYFGHLVDGQVSALRWFGGGFQNNGGAGLTLGNGARDISVDGASFVHNNGMGISAEWGVTSVSSSTFTDNKGPGVWFQNYGNFHNDTFTSTGAQTIGVTGWQNGGVSLTGSTSTGSPLANLQGYGSAFLTGDSGQVTTGSNIAVGGAGGANVASVSVSSQGVALPALAAVTLATTAAAANSTGTGVLETALDAAIAGGTVAHLTNASYTVTAPIIINITSSNQGPIGIDLGGAKILSQIAGGGPVIEIIVAAGVNVGTLSLSNFMIQGSGLDGDGIKIIADGTNRSIQNLVISNVNIEHVGGIGLDIIGNVAHGTVFDSWMHGNTGGGARFANGAGGGTVSDIDWVGGGFRKNGVAGLILDNGAKDLSVKGAYFVENYGPGIHATSGITLVQESGFENNTGAGAVVKGTSAFVDDTFSTYGPQQAGVAGYLTGSAKISLTGDSNEYYGGGADTTVLANVQGNGTLAIAGGGKVVAGPGIGVTGGDANVTPPADTTLPALSSIATSGTGIVAGSGALNAGDVITLTMTLSEAVTVAGGAPTLTLNDGGTATYTAGSGSSTLTFTHTVQAGQNVADLAVSSLGLNGSTIKDASGNSASLSAVANYNPAGTLQIDTTAPAVSSIATSGIGITAGGGALGVGKVVTLTVTMTEAVTVTGTPTLTLNDGGIATYTGGSGGSALNFAYTVAAGQNTPDLAITSLNLNGGSLIDRAGNAATLSGAANYNPSGTLKIDTATSTAAPIVTAVLANDTGSSSSDKVTSNAALSGTSDPNAVVRFTIDGTPSTATVTANAAGVWSFTPTSLAEGAHNIVASETNAGGLTGASTLAFTLDTAAPKVTANLATTLAVMSLGADAGTALTGSGDANMLVHFTVDGSAVAGTTTADSSGLWSYTTGALANGPHTTVASQTDLSGNTGSASLSFTTGSTAPPPLTEKLLNDTGISNNDSITSDAVLTGTADPNAVVHFTVDGTQIATTATANASGVWSYSPTGLSDGQHTIVASESNAGGATGAASLAFTLDTKGTNPVFTGGTMSNGQVTVTGTAEAGSTLSIYDGNNWAGFATAGGDGRFTFTTAGDTTVSHRFGAIAIDLAGNEGKTPSAYVVTPGAPAAPVVTEKLVGDTGASSTDRITSTPTLTGTADANAIVHFTVDGTAIAGTATANASGVWSYMPIGLSDGQHTIVASETNASGVTGTASLTFTLDTKAPVVTEKFTNGTLSGTGDANAVVHLTLDGSAVAATATADSGGAWSYTPTGLVNGTHTIAASETDPAGNIGSASLSFTVGATAPTVTEKLAIDTGGSSIDKITSSAALTGTADPNSVVHFAVDGASIAATATANASGGWSYAPTGLTDGQHTIVASETNAGGGTGSASLSFTLDTQTTVPVFASAVQANDRVTLAGTSEAASTLSIYDGNSWLGFATSGTDGSWSFTGKGVANTVHSYGEIATDLAGNESKTPGKLILGSSGTDNLTGSASADVIQGGGGSDKLTGGAGADTFTFRAASESNSASADTITDFVHGIDKIDFTAIAGINASNQVPQFQGKLSGTGNLTLGAHSVAFLEVGGNTMVLANTGNVAETVTAANTSAADMKIVLLGVNLGLTGTDFHHS